MVPRPQVKDNSILVMPKPNGDISEKTEENTALTSQTKSSKKRKRDHSAKHDVPHADKSKQKKQKKEKSVQNTMPVADLSEEDQGSDAEAEEDGAMDSDFEFDLGGFSTGVTEDFDGWELSNSTKRNSGPKKGVDIDDLIARRQRKKAGRSANGGADDAIALDSSDGEILSEEEKEDGREDVADEDDGDNDTNLLEEDDEDELLASDGFGMGATGEDDDSDVADDMDAIPISDEEEESDNESSLSAVSHPHDQDTDTSDLEDDDEEEKAKQQAFFAPEDAHVQPRLSKGSAAGFQSMSLSRPILRGLASVGFVDPTPIQAKTIPVALLGKDVVGGAVTGSGKTAAFMIPILERLLYRPRKIPTSRVAILMPTRELAVQCFNVARKLASFTDVTFCQLVGGFSLREQEIVLRSRPDVIIATPGRFIDHMRNSASFTVDTLEILVLDEADRMLEDGFADELNEILTTIPKSRQTMLFSATMTSTVDKLIRIGLNQPVRLLVDAKRQTVGTLTQEFVRLRPGREDKRLAYLMHLCTTLYTQRCIIFFRQKKEAHRVRIIFGLFGLKVAELHGSMTQEQRITSVESFRAGTVSHLLATDVASRGLDIRGVESVVNYEAPQSHEIYLHRVGRTARAGREGRACTLAAEPDRKVVKAAVKAGRAQAAKIVSRVVEAGLVDAWAAKIAGVEDEVQAILEEEREEKTLRGMEVQVTRGQNLVEHEAEIMSRPKRTWFASEGQKTEMKKKAVGELIAKEGKTLKGLGGGKLSGKDKKRLDDRRERLEGRAWKKGARERGLTERDVKVKSAGKSAAKGGTKKGGRPGGRPGGKGKGGKTVRGGK